MHNLMQQMLIARGIAIDAYARHEIGLNFLFAQLLGVTPDVAGIIFFKFNNAPTRVFIVEKLLLKRHRDTYKKFWDSIDGPLRKIEEERNHIVHWTILRHLPRGGPLTKVTLTPNNLLAITKNTPQKSVDDLNAFSEKCDFFNELLGLFRKTLKDPDKVPATWRDIFQQPVVYPPPDTHPIIQKRKARESQPPSSSE